MNAAASALLNISIRSRRVLQDRPVLIRGAQMENSHGLSYHDPWNAVGGGAMNYV